MTSLVGDGVRGLNLGKEPECKGIKGQEYIQQAENRPEDHLKKKPSVKVQEAQCPKRAQLSNISKRDLVSK